MKFMGRHRVVGRTKGNPGSKGSVGSGMRSDEGRCANKKYIKISIMEFKSVISIIIIQFAFHFCANTLTSKFRIRNPLSTRYKIEEAKCLRSAKRKTRVVECLAIFFFFFPVHFAPIHEIKQRHFRLRSDARRENSERKNQQKGLKIQIYSLFIFALELKYKVKRIKMRAFQFTISASAELIPEWMSRSLRKGKITPK